MKQVKRYMLDLHFTLDRIKYSNPQYIRKIIKEFGAKLWHDDLQKKNSLLLYREYTHIIHDEQDLYDNSAAATTLFRARTGTLKINIERRHTDGYTNCEICKACTTEDIENFLLDCEALTSTGQNQKQTREAQTAYSRHICRFHHNSGNQAPPIKQTNPK